MKRKFRLGITFGELTDRIARGEMQLHKFPRGFIVTEIKEFAEERILMVQFVRGERFEEWKTEALEKLRDFARTHQCVAIEAICRLGLEKKLAPLGFKKTRVLLRTDLL